MITKGLAHIFAFSSSVISIWFDSKRNLRFLLNEFHSESEAEPTIVRSSIEGGVKVVREFCCASVNAVKEKKKPVDDFIATGIGHSQCEFMILQFFPVPGPFLNLCITVILDSIFNIFSCIRLFKSTSKWNS